MPRTPLCAAARSFHYGWVATTLALVADLHLAATLHNCPWTEYCHPEIYPHQELRRNLFGPEPRMVDGVFELPSGPGLGVEVDEAALATLRSHLTPLLRAWHMRITTTVVGSYPQPDWLIDRERLKRRLPPRVRAQELWRVDPEFLQEALDDATVLARTGHGTGGHRRGQRR